MQKVRSKIVPEKKKQSFEESLGELEQIVKRLEEGDVPLEEALEYYKKGMTLSNFCQETLSSAEKTLTKMMNEDGKEIVFDASDEVNK